MMEKSEQFMWLFLEKQKLIILMKSLISWIYNTRLHQGVNILPKCPDSFSEMIEMAKYYRAVKVDLYETKARYILASIHFLMK